MRQEIAPREIAMTDADTPDPAFDTFTSRLIRREAQRRAALELSTTTPAGLESALAKISAEVTDEAAEAKSTPQSPSPPKA
jgi:phage shock protein A